MRSGSPPISGASVRPSALVTVSLRSPRALAPISCSAIFTPAAGRPLTVSSTWVESRPSVFGLPGPSTLATSAQPGDQADLVQRRGPFGRGVVPQPALELRAGSNPGCAGARR